MKHDKLFPTHVYLFDNVIDDNSLLQIKKDITLSCNQTTKNWQSKASLHKNVLYDKLTHKIVENSKKVFDSLYYEYHGFNITDMWSNILKPGETHRPHTHSNNILSGVFYVEAEQTSGIIFADPRPQAGVIQPSVTNQVIDNANKIKYDSVSNRMIMFPSWLQHYVPINETNSNRISIAFNVMLKGIVGSSKEYQSAEF
tara:strand:+ start:45 stop:641 length:597 start_codon:yes stop_codon:yes gene_type:complete